MQLPGCGEAIDAGQVDVEDRDVGPGVERGGQDLLTALQLSDDLHIAFE